MSVSVSVSLCVVCECVCVCVCVVLFSAPPVVYKSSPMFSSYAPRFPPSCVTSSLHGPGGSVAA